MNFSDYIIYVDESGDHELSKIDPGYPIFVLDFCIFSKTHYAEVLVPKIQTFKFQYFGHDLVVLHEREINKKAAPFGFLQFQKKYEAFMADLSQIIADTDFTIIAAAIDKPALNAKYFSPLDPYELAMGFCLERAYRFLEEKKQDDRITHVIVECRGPKEDKALELAFRRICDGSNAYNRRLNFDIIFGKKSSHSAGLEFADLTARPIGRHVLNPHQKNKAYDIIGKKFRRSPNGIVNGWGLKVFPLEKTKGPG